MPNLHTRNPLRQPGVSCYFDMDRPEIVQSLQANNTRAKRIVEIGCGAARTSASVRKALEADYYLGIEMNEDAAERARDQIDQVIVADIEKSTPADLGVAENDFDLLLALDVLEHLYNPWDVLADWARVLRPGGRALLSIPNIQNIEVIAGLVHGQFLYGNSGLRDVTHVRFFTGSSAMDLVVGAGLVPVATDLTLGTLIHGKDIRDSDNTITAGKLTISGLSKQEATPFAVWQFLITAERPAAQEGSG